MIPKTELRELLQVASNARWGEVEVLTPEQASEVLKWIESLENGDCRHHCQSRLRTMSP